MSAIALTLISPQGAATAFGTIPRVRAYKVVAIFDAGLNDYNNSVVFLPLPAAQIYFQKPDVVTQHRDPMVTIRTGRRAAAAASPHAAWHAGAGCATGGTPTTAIISVLQVQKDTMFIVLGMIVLVAAFNVVSSLIMMVKDKTRDIAVLRTHRRQQRRGACASS